MQIEINNIQVKIEDGETIIEACRRIGLDIPSLCWSKNAVHKSSCMVCAVRNLTNGQIIPSCTTLPTEGMHIDTESDEVKGVRKMSLDLLLSDHRADCEAPCSLVCPEGLDVEAMLNCYDKDKFEDALGLIKHAFQLPVLACDTCKAPCEKACRRRNVDTAVSIRQIIKEITELFDASEVKEVENAVIDKKMFQSKLGRFTDGEKQRLKETVSSKSRCLHCACDGRSRCSLRQYAGDYQIKRPRYNMGSAMPVMTKVNIKGQLWFEQAKCIRCGLCVYNSNNGFTFKDRGFGMEVILPEENKSNVPDGIESLCPTGALYLNVD
ncbi:2Fe-2S iron-sulfur cluster-binding protein [Carboxylicivirga sp. M1479]|uniref:2Fe-2S iron-sulfur cluster-binding protein n=1 Tax=Carboxylicivirga sp. M1479 TaxID=2594476 RepID=UPI0011785BDA|nr:2Fe-2S iron-sulfur cluster-binding protein [Carboxylicivirga sp. M1479]TRX70612.1 formate dehydrogenase [Carboxylicivirga sp. M1479]